MLHYYVKNCLVLLLLVLYSFSGFAQSNTKEFRKLMWEGNQGFEIGDYLNAKNAFEKAEAIDSSNKELNYKLGMCKFEIKKFRNDSRKNFERIKSADYPEVNYYLGILYHLSKEFDKAIACFTAYQSAKGEKEHLAKEINDLLIKCYSAQLLESTKYSSVEIENLGPTINTEFPEYVPLIPADEKFMIFTSRRKNVVHDKQNVYGEYYEDIYQTFRNNGNWTAPKLLDSAINTVTHDACTGLSADGEKLLLFRTSKDTRTGDILESNFINAVWTKPTPLRLNVNSSDYIESSACYSPNNDIVFFSSNRMGGFGGKDLYYVKKLPDGTWGIPRNLGENVNTEYNEDAPFVDALGKTVYFSSEGHTNMGGYDVFKSNFDEAGYFTKAVNLGSPINTVNDDVFFVLNPDSSVAYLSSEREGGYGSQDIYKVYFNDNPATLKVYDVHVQDEQNTVIKNVDITLYDAKSNELVGKYKSNPNSGKIIFISRPQRQFKIQIQANGFETKMLENYSLADNYEVLFTLTKSAK
jgi:tetratricopeptide (TPR) repeat protein